ncbi:hypothetical protein EV648_103669 [Kribbella sp. VKM Ac-2568]|nr:hypothetical protein EV648_103669 [Kribbella sp. VKM Ac-2568]
MARVAGMASRLVRGTAIACGVAAIAGLGIGYALGEPVSPDDILPARKLPADLCARIGDVSTLLPKATKPTLVQTGTSTVNCSAKADEQTQPTHTAAAVSIHITPYAGKAAGAGQPPFTPATVARQTFQRKSWQDVKDRPFPTKLDKRGDLSRQGWRISVLELRADIIVQVDYTAHPIDGAVAEQAALVLADRAIWEAK